MEGHGPIAMTHRKSCGALDNASQYHVREKKKNTYLTKGAQYRQLAAESHE